MKRLGWLAVALLAVLAGCGGDQGENGGGEPAAEFVFNNNTEPETLDPARMTGQPEMRLAEGLFEGLVNYDPRDLSIVPGVAESWDVSADGLTYTFHLRECRWSNGDPVTANDFVYAWRRVLTLSDPPARYAHQIFDYIAGAKAVYDDPDGDAEFTGATAADDRTLVVRLIRPTAYFLDLCAFATLYPVHRGCVEEHGERFWTRPGNLVGNGAFVLAEHVDRRHVLLRKNPRYWDAANVALDAARALPVENEDTAFNFYETGRLDWTSPVPLALVADLRGRPDFRVAPFLATYFYRFNVTRQEKGLGDARLRRALSLAIDRERITRELLVAGEAPAFTFVPPGLPGYQPATNPLTFDPEEARRLLAAAGYPNGENFPELEVLYNTSEAHRQVAAMIQYDWQQHLNIRVNLRNKEWQVYMADTDNATRNYDIARAGWIGDYLDPHTFLELFVTDNGNNRCGWSDAEYDRLVTAARAETDAARRAALYRQAEERLLAEVPIMPVYFYVSKNLVRERVRGWYPNLRDIHPLKAISLAPAAE